MRAGLVERAPDFPWSSAWAHVVGADPAGLLDRELWREIAPLGDWASVLTCSPADEHDWTQRFRAATYAVKPLGSQESVEQLEGAGGSFARAARAGKAEEEGLGERSGEINIEPVPVFPAPEGAVHALADVVLFRCAAFELFGANPPICG